MAPVFFCSGRFFDPKRQEGPSALVKSSANNSKSEGHGPFLGSSFRFISGDMNGCFQPRRSSNVSTPSGPSGPLLFNLDVRFTVGIGEIWYEQVDGGIPHHEKVVGPAKSARSLGPPSVGSGLGARSC